ncbi:YtpR family tRNA-binding protein [[Mycoplasma] testudinis]|uniref:YtpR family tRNA-binding protein n=1 Tax=[Mycoplasma] testudinis TaxID=33924 RepID=UPI0004880E08|nr:hypothetical protein [[Mycoplasma] testudinis]
MSQNPQAAKKFLNLFYQEKTLQDTLVGFVKNPLTPAIQKKFSNYVLFYDLNNELVAFNISHPKALNLEIKEGLNAPTTKLIEQLNKILGIDLSSYAEQYPIIIGQIKKVQAIPKSHLNYCEVDIGNESLQKIVCGGTNVRENQYVVVVLPNATIPLGKYITASTVLDYESNGMICSTRELGMLPQEGKVILELSEEQAKNEIGQPFKQIY